MGDPTHTYPTFRRRKKTTRRYVWPFLVSGASRLVIQTCGGRSSCCDERLLQARVSLGWSINFSLSLPGRSRHQQACARWDDKTWIQTRDRTVGRPSSMRRAVPLRQQEPLEPREALPRPSSCHWKEKRICLLPSGSSYESSSSFCARSSKAAIQPCEQHCCCSSCCA